MQPLKLAFKRSGGIIVPVIYFYAPHEIRPHSGKTRAQEKQGEKNYNPERRVERTNVAPVTSIFSAFIVNPASSGVSTNPIPTRWPVAVEPTGSRQIPFANRNPKMEHAEIESDSVKFRRRPRQ